MYYISPHPASPKKNLKYAHEVNENGTLRRKYARAQTSIRIYVTSRTNLIIGKKTFRWQSTELADKYTRVGGVVGEKVLGDLIQYLCVSSETLQRLSTSRSSRARKSCFEDV